MPSDPFKLSHVPACHTELVSKKGYPLETYEAVTEDGYILTVHRIPHGVQRNTEKGNKPVVYLQHGITLASNSFAILNANESMAFILADAGKLGARSAKVSVLLQF
jgi:hypothetical protein